MKYNQILLIASYNSVVGNGHYSRLSNLKKKLEDKRIPAKIILKKFNNHLDKFRKILLDKKSLLILDLSANFSKKVIKYFDIKRSNVIAIDCLETVSEKLKFCWIPNICFQKKKNVFGGLKNILVEDYKKRKFNKNKPKILVSLGNSSRKIMVQKMATTLEKKNIGSQIIWIKGKHQNIPRFSKKFSKNVKIFNFRKNISYFLRKSDYAITPFGVFFYQCCYSGIPVVTFDNENKNDLLILKKLNKICKYFTEIKLKKSVNLLKKLINNKIETNKYHDFLRKKFKQNGLNRLATKIISVL